MTPPQRILVTGAGGRLGAALLRNYGRDLDLIGFTRVQLDVADTDEMRSRLARENFDLLINCAAQTNVDRCEVESVEAFCLNAEAPGVLAEICERKGARLLHISTDYVFDGEKSEPYREEDNARPISVYGESKLEGERRVLEVNPKNLVARVSWVFGPDRPSFVDGIIKNARENEHVDAIADKVSTPSYTSDIGTMLRALFENEETHGLFHLTNRGECSWQQYGQWALDCCEAEGLPLRARTVDAIRLRDLKNFIARRPVYTVLSTEKFQRVSGQVPRDWREAVAEYVRDHVVPSFR